MAFFQHPSKSIRVYSKLLWRQAKITTRRALKALGYSEIYVARSLKSRKKRSVTKVTESLTRDAIYEHGKRIAEEHAIQDRPRNSHLLYRRFRFNCKILDLAHSLLEDAARNQEPLTPGAEWLLDNHHLVLQQIAAIRKHFPRGYDRTLPKLASGRLRDYPRVYDLALELLQKTDAVVNVDLLSSFIRGYQSVAPLTMGELWAIPIMIRFALIENLSAIVSRMADARDERQSAGELISQIIGDESKTGTQILEALTTYINQKHELLFRGSSHIIARLREMGRKAYLALQWLEERIREEGLDPEELHRNEQYLLAADQVSIGNTFSSLRSVNLLDWKEWFEDVSVVDRMLSQDPAGFYRRSDFKTRDSFRHVVELIAKWSKLNELEIATKAVDFAEQRKGELAGEEPLYRTKRSHVGYYLSEDGLGEFENFLRVKPPILVSIKRALRRWAFPLYSLSVIGLTSLMLFYLIHYLIKFDIGYLPATLISIFFIVPASDLATSFVQWLVTHLVRPAYLSKLDLSLSIPDECRTAVAVQVIFNDKLSIKKSVEALEIRYLANTEKNLVFGLLADLPDADAEHLPGDQELIDYAGSLIAELCNRHGPAFFCIFRRRQWNPSQKKWMGWERKRGKIDEFNRFLLNPAAETSFNITDSHKEILRGIVYIVTLDNDTQLPHGSVHKLIGTIAHPLNAPLIKKNGEQSSIRIAEGYSVIQPRVGVSLVSSSVSRFARLFSGHAGLDPYTQTVSEVYQDLFSEGSFVGKGIYKVDAFHAALESRVPENAILSHDLFEGLHARVALATDIELFEDFSSRYHVHARRQHRWVRGDWQLLPWTAAFVPDEQRKYRKTPLNNLGRWKLIDNLRRSLLAPSLYFYFLCIFTMLGASSYYLSLLGILVVAFPVYANVAQAFLIPPRGLSLESHVKGLGRNIFLNSKQAIFTLCFIPHQAALMLNAICVTLYRLFISKENFLEWETAYHSERRLSVNLTSFLREMGGGIFLWLVAIFLISFTGHLSNPLAIILLTLWGLAPLIAKYLSDPISGKEFEVSALDREYLQEIAFHTWRYFREHINAENNYLVPDNIQLVPHKVVVDRTSITNISLSLLTVTSAYDFGFMSLTRTATTLNNIFSSMERLERFHGHFFNWYNVRNLTTLAPRYISMVDSGNMLGYLICLRSIFGRVEQYEIAGKKHWPHAQYLLKKLEEEYPSKDLQPLLAETRQALDEPSHSLFLTHRRLEALQKIAAEYARLISDTPAAENSSLLSELEDIIEAKRLIEWLPELLSIFNVLDEASVKAPELSNLESCLRGALFNLSMLQECASLIDQFLEFLASGKLPSSIANLVNDRVTDFNRKYRPARAEAERIAQLLAGLSEQNARMIQEMDFRFLYDSERDLFPIGYDADNARRDQSYYDLLASEARLGSFSAIAIGQIPQKHWFALGRPLTDTIGGKVLLSWSGTMFEYLMPLLCTRDFPRTLLSESFRAAVRTQILYAAKRGVPWGISESGYSGVDFEKTYQYHAFGVPGLGLKRGLDTDLVISPYSTFMALPFAYEEGIDNLRRLEAEEARGEYGFYEAIDYTPTRLRDNEKRHVVQSHLAHHQGIIVVALNNLLNGNVMQNRFHEDLQVRAAELLLHEKFPERVPIITPHGEHEYAIQRIEPEDDFVTTQILNSAHTPLPVTHLLSNSHYSLMIDNAGSGFASFDRDLALTRWREDAALNNYGFYVFIRDLDNQKLWSNTYQPSCVEPDHYDVIFGPDKAEFKRRDDDIFLHTEVTVSPEDNVEIRRITFTNLSPYRRTLDFTSYGEVVLGSPRADSAHPAFAKMFIESEYIADIDSLLFSRRPRSKHESKMFFMHMVTMRTVWGKVTYETSRPHFLGRCNTIQNPEALEFGRELGGHSGYVLDPIFSLRTKLELEPGQSETVTFVNAAARDKDTLFSIGHRYKQMHQISRAFEMAWSQSSVELRNEKIAARQAQVYQRLGNILLHNFDKLRAKPELIAQNRLAQPALWRFGISGDLPIVLLRITEPDQIKIVQELLAAHHYLRVRGLVFDLVILNEYPGGYLQNLQEELEYIIRASFSGFLMDKNGGVFLRTAGQISQTERELLQVVARAVMRGSRGSLAAQLKFEEAAPDKVYQRSSPVPVTALETVPPALKQCEFFNGYGGFANNGNTYRFFIEKDSFPPLPWSNVIAHESFGTLVTESGGGYTWADNSRENRLSTWSNDPANDPLAEIVYVRDVDTSKFWSLTPRPVRTKAAYLVEHNFGESSFQAEIEGIESKLTISVVKDRKIKVWRAELKNKGKRVKELELFLYVEWVLGVSRDDTVRFITPSFDSASKTLYAQNFYNVDFAGRLVGIGSSGDVKSFTTQRSEFIGRNGSHAEPIAFLAKDIQPGVSTNLNKKLAIGADSCGVIKVAVKLQPFESKTLSFYMVEAANIDELRTLAAEAEAESPGLKDFYLEVNDSLQIKTPDRSFDLLINSWLLYQVLACRLFARTGFYQSGGAFGFRDQLQDVMAVAHTKPEITRKQILLHAEHQFPEGDVQHWWHPPSGKGVRTKISDDFLWLPYVTCRYLEATADFSILDEQCGFVSAPALAEHEHEIYVVPQIASHKASLYEHCILAIERGLNFGQRGLPLMGAGDWNDGMNEVGIGGKGESVWLAWFTIDVLNKFSEIVERKNDNDRAKRYREISVKLAASVEEHAWDGEWYRRAYFDDGTPLGSKTNDECQIDSISQSWGVISGAAGNERSEKAMQQVVDQLIKIDDRIICLLQPPFNQGTLQPGYIKGYLPGIRENGGQYTHAAAWTIIAEAIQGKGTLAAEHFSLINPINHTKDNAGAQKYMGEPYVFCGDVYAVEPHSGRAGWSWYTGSAGWMYKAGVEYILGLKLYADYFTVNPCIPSSWREYSLAARLRGSRFNISVLNPNGRETGEIEVSVNGEDIPEKKIIFQKYTGQAEVEVKIQIK